MTGRLSWARIVLPQAGQWERPKTTVSPRGTRWATTFRKLPAIEPSTNASTSAAAEPAGEKSQGANSAGHMHVWDGERDSGRVPAARTGLPCPMNFSDSIEKPGARRLLPGWLSVCLRVVGTAALMGFALSGQAWYDHEVDGKTESGILSAISRADWRWCAAGLITGLCVQVLAGIRWAALARPLGFAGSRRFFVWRFFEGSFFSLFLPSSIGGDVVKALRVGNTTSRRLLVGCSLVADRLTGVAALGVICASAYLATVCKLGVLATLAVGAVLLAVALAVFWVGVGSLDRLLQLMPLPASARGFASRLLPYQQRPSLMLKAVAWSLLVQLGGAVAVAMLGRSVGVEQPASVWFTVVPLLSLAMVVPFTINGIGVREGGMKLLLAPHGVPEALAVAIGGLWLAASLCGGLIGGVLFLLDRKPASLADTDADAAVTAG